VENGVSIFLKIVTQLQSMYKACSVCTVPTAINFFKQAFYFVVGGTDRDRGNMQQMVHNQLIMLFGG